MKEDEEETKEDFINRSRSRQSWFWLVVGGDME
jgi:hypothetical protein